LEPKTTKEAIVVGRIGAPYGVRGWLKVKSFTDPIDNILNYQPWLLSLKGTQISIRVLDGKIHSSTIVAKIEGCDDRDKALKYTNAEILVYRDQFAELEQDEYYWSDLIGLTVIKQDESVVGILDHMFSTGANDIMLVKGEKDYYIPYIFNTTVLSVNLKARTIHIKWDEFLDNAGKTV
jgi:16S rRNA processing protein RimM